MAQLFRHKRTGVQVISVEFTEKVPVYHFTVLKKKGKTITVEVDTHREEDALQKQVNRKLPVLVHFFGKGVLNRTVTPQDNYLDNLIVNASKSDFISAFQDAANLRLVSFMRKEPADEVIEKLDFCKDQVVDILLGPFVAFRPDLETIPVKVPGFEFNYVQTGFSATETKDRKVEFLGNILGQEVFGAIAGWNYLNEKDRCSILDEQEKEKRRANFSDKRQFEKLGLFMLVFFLAALLANYFYQGNLLKKNATIEDEIMIYSDNLNKIDLLDQEIKRKYQLISTSGILKHNYLSFYLDRIGKSLPSTINLVEIRTFPLDKKLKQKVKTEFEQSSVYVSGTTNNTASIDEWIARLNEQNWVAKTEILNFERNQEKQNASFTLRIRIR